MAESFVFDSVVSEPAPFLCAKSHPPVNFTLPVCHSKDPCQEMEQIWIDNFKMVTSLFLVKSW